MSRALAGFAAVAAQSAVVVTLLAAAPAHAQDLMIRGFTCAGIISWDGATLSCGSGSSPTFACNWSPTPPSGVTANQAFSLGVSCNGTAQSSVWSTVPAGGATFSNTATSATATMPSPGSWTVQAVVTGPNGATSTVQASITAQAAQQLPIQTGNYNCGTSFANTRTLTLPAWTIGVGGHTHLRTADAGGFGANDAVVVEITTPAVLGRNVFGSISWVEWSGPPAARVAALADPGHACDFTHGVGNNPAATANGIINGTLYFSAGPNDSGWPALTLPNTKYFLNIKNDGCQAGTCNIDLEFVAPK